MEGMVLFLCFQLENMIQPLGILFFLTSFIIFNAIKEEVFDKNTYKFILLMSLFSFQMKQTGVYLILIMIPYVYLYIKKNKLKTIGFFKNFLYVSFNIF